MKRMRWKRALGLLLALVMLTAAAFALADGGYDLVYDGILQYGYVVSDGHQAALVNLVAENGGTVPAYCVDSSVYIAENSRYARCDMEGEKGRAAVDTEKLRSIVTASYPYSALKDVKKAAKLPNLTEQEAVTGAQMAIWRVVEGLETTCDNENVTKLLAYYLALPGTPALSEPLGSVGLTMDVTEENGLCNAVYTYFTTAKNADGSPVTLAHRFTKDLAAAYGATVTEEANGDGLRTVRVAGLPADAVFDFVVSGTQKRGADVYYYRPQGGNTASQSLVGMYAGEASLTAGKTFSCTVPERYSLKIQKYDSTTQKGVEGAVFELCDNAAFTDPVLYEKATDADGYVEFTGLTAGTWHLREKQAPPGYIPDVKVYDVTVDAEPNDVIRFKNTHYGEIRIVKVDENGAPVEGATFDIYAGAEETGEPLYRGLLTDADGVILAGNIVPGTYCVVETAAPTGYHLAEEHTAVITVDPHASVAVPMVNPNIVRGKLRIAKADYVTGEFLPGCEIGVYRDEACTDVIATYTTVLPAGVTFTVDNYDAEQLQCCEDLLPGTYFVKELKAPEGYIINPKNQIVPVTLEEGETEIVLFRNRPRIDTAGNYGLLLLVGLGAVLTSGGLLLVCRKKLVRKTSK